MPRNGSGVASQPSNTAAVSGDNISSTKYNAVNADVYNLFNTKWPQSLTATLAELGGQPVNINLTSLSALGTAADKIAYTTAAGAWAESAFPAWARSFNGSVDLPAARAYFHDPAVKSLSTMPVIAGDVIYGIADGAFARLAKGTALQSFRMNAGATAPEWGVPSIGDGQVWTNMLPSRAYATTYENTSGKHITVSVTTDNNSPSISSFTFEVGVTAGTLVTIALADTLNNDNFSQMIAIVPAGHFYRVTQTGGTNTAPPRAWAELR